MVTKDKLGKAEDIRGVDDLQKAKCRLKIGSMIRGLGGVDIITIQSLKYDPINDIKYSGDKICYRALINGFYWYIDDIVVISI